MNLEFLEKAEMLKPELIYKTEYAAQLVEIERKGGEYKVVSAGKPEILSEKTWKKGDKICLDFGKHCVGYLEFDAGTSGNPQDNPGHIKVKFGETPCEISEDFAKYGGNISSSWLQEERIYLENLPKRIKIQRRYAFRYVEIEVLDTSHQFQLVIENICCQTVTSAERTWIPPLKCQDARLREIDRVSINTLEGCMQDVFEDGPKRDRRLWIGDLRLQALTNYATFRNYELVKRCLYLFAADPLKNGKTGSCLYVEPKLIVDTALHLFDYSLFFVSCLYDYYRASKDRNTLEELWKIAYDQVILASLELDENYLIHDHPEDWWWCFVDWNPKLNKQASAQAILIWTAKQAKKLADILGADEEKARLEQIILRCSEAAVRYLWDEDNGFFISGTQGQVSWASQVWFVLAGIFSKEKNKELLFRLKKENPDIRMNTPYMNHCYVEALIETEMLDEAKEHMKFYWGSMVDSGADCFWEVYDPEKPNLSAYGDRIINSYCHAWSCTPSYFIRTYFSESKGASRFAIKEQGDHIVTEIKDVEDKNEMNWVSEGKQWGKMILPDGICGNVKRHAERYYCMEENYTFTNTKSTDYFSGKEKIGIQLPFPDSYTTAEICMKQRCHVHIWCGEEVSYIAAIRMGGQGSNMGLVLTEGAVSGYGVLRDEKDRSNDRGTFIIYPKIKHLNPGESVKITWKLFWFDSEAQFERGVRMWGSGIEVLLDRGVFFADEESKMIVRHRNTAKPAEIELRKNGSKLKLIDEGIAAEKICIIDRDTKPGEKIWRIQWNGKKTWAKTLVLPPIEQLAEKRCRFIVEKQQYQDRFSHLHGCFLIYDNETEQVYYSDTYDHNAGRERVGMGVVLAAYLQNHRNLQWENALEQYTEYVYRELYDEKTGTVYNDVQKNNEWHRLYNYPWMALFFMERYRWKRAERDLRNMYRILCAYYREGGEKFYAIGIPMKESIELLREAGMKDEENQLLELYKKHGNLIAENGVNYPPHEVNYEQSIVAPAVSYMLQLYQLTGNKKYLNAGKEQLKVLELFNGHQPDYHLYEVAIRHWDGYWFGKKRVLGDTFPHYWSSLTGIAYKYYAQITGENMYFEKAENSLRGSLSMIFPDGQASCAYVYPEQVNDLECGYYDPWANDQDWGLYFYLKEGQRYDYDGKAQ